MVGHGKIDRSLSVNIHEVANQKPIVNMSRARLRINYFDHNIIGLKDVSGGRKRKAAGMSGGWLARVLESRRSPWKQPRRRGKPVKNEMGPKDIKCLSSNVHLTDENIQVDMVEAVKSIQFRMLEGVMVSEQKNELLLGPGRYACRWSERRSTGTTTSSTWRGRTRTTCRTWTRCPR